MRKPMLQLERRHLQENIQTKKKTKITRTEMTGKNGGAKEERSQHCIHAVGGRLRLDTTNVREGGGNRNGAPEEETEEEEGRTAATADACQE
jgi:hypothetical protein